MKAINAGIVCFVLLLVPPIFTSSPVHANGDQLHPLLLKEVADTDENINSSYEYGKERYPLYAYHGLQENFLIKRSAVVSIDPSKIDLIEIEKAPFSPSERKVYTVSIHLKPDGAKKIRAYTKENLNERVAFEIDGKIFIIAKILSLIEDEINLVLSKKSIQEITAELQKVCNNVIIKENEVNKDL
jgi:preprotein translocase subunit SecD